MDRSGIIGWRAWHWDGERRTVYSSANTGWRELPWGVVGVVEYRGPPYRKIWDGHDWVWVETGRFRIVDTHPEWGQWSDPPAGVNELDLKRGAPVPDEAWAGIQREMFEAREAP